MCTTAPYGSWNSPITPELISTNVVGLSEIIVDDDRVLWTEKRPGSGGRRVLVGRDDAGQVIDFTGDDVDVKSRVHEYGGGAVAACRGVAVFSDALTGRLFRTTLDTSHVESPPIQPITPENPAVRYGDLLFDRNGERVFCVREDHRGDGECSNLLTVIDPNGPNEDYGRPLFEGTDFCSSPALAPDGTTLAWLSWNHPNMPWDGTYLSVARLSANGVTDVKAVAGSRHESVVQPRWHPDGRLFYISDRTGWWNLYVADGAEHRCLLAIAAEFADPQWLLGSSSYDLLDRRHLVCTWKSKGVAEVGVLDIESGRWTPIDLAISSAAQIRTVGGSAAMILATPTELPRLVTLDVSSGTVETLRRSTPVEIPKSFISPARPIQWRSRDATSYGYLFPPTNPEYEAPDGELPPLLVMPHGGPTAVVTSAMSLGIQFWTSRGFAVLAVNYGGSTGYGRAYRERLRTNWGIVDVEDSVAGALHLVRSGVASADRVGIRGASSGGFTALAALTTYDIFRGAAIHAGVGDLTALVQETHKFESRYLERLVGPYPERRDIYDERSPLRRVDRLNCPIVLFQGAEDRIVPPAQAVAMARAVRDKGQSATLLVGEGEGHGFRRGRTIRAALLAELEFWGRVFGFEPADRIDADELESVFPCWKE